MSYEHTPGKRITKQEVFTHTRGIIGVDTAVGLFKDPKILRRNEGVYILRVLEKENPARALEVSEWLSRNPSGQKDLDRYAKQLVKILANPQQSAPVATSGARLRDHFKKALGRSDVDVLNTKLRLPGSFEGGKKK